MHAVKSACLILLRRQNICIKSLYTHKKNYLFCTGDRHNERAAGQRRTKLVDIVMGCERVMAKVMAVTSMSTNKCVSTYFISFRDT